VGREFNETVDGFGKYEYEEIFKTLSEHGFVVISEIRSKDRDSLAYGRRIT
jgi:sugar phosphate isomerase/epimerase